MPKVLLYLCGLTRVASGELLAAKKTEENIENGCREM